MAPSIYLLVLEYYSLVTLIEYISLVEGGGDLLSPFLGDLGWPEGDGDLRSHVGSGEITFLS